ncbi:cold shock small protein YmcF [Erwinia oleae]
MKVCIINFKLQCPSCFSSQYRFSQLDITSKNPHGAKCIFCKSIMQVSAKRLTAA